MIAASDPQEFVPSGRQQALKHPGPSHFLLNHHNSHNHSRNTLGPRSEEFALFDKLERFSLKEEPDNEWWILRKVSRKLSKKSTISVADSPDKSGGAQSDETCAQDASSSGNLKSSSHGKKSKRASGDSGRLTGSRRSSSAGQDVAKSYRLQDRNGIKHEATWVEDELYIKGHTAVWSRGLFDSPDIAESTRKTVCSYTTQMPIRHALWCTFYSERPSYDTGLLTTTATTTADNNQNDANENSKIDDCAVKEEEEQKPKGTPVPSVCVIDHFTIRVFTQSGEDFSIAVPFPVGNVWSCKYGILIEKEVDDTACISKSFEDNTNRSTLYSLAYPLDEISPVALSMSSPLLQTLNSPNLKVIYTSDSPISICMVYDTNTQQHSVYRIRKVRNSEKADFALNNNKGDSMMCPSTTASLSEKLRNRFSIWDCVKNAKYLPIPNSLNSRPSSLTSFVNLHQSKSHSSMATMSRCQSPATSSVGGGSPWIPSHSRTSQHILTANASLLSGGVKNSAAQHIADMSKSWSPVNTNPNLCLEHLWTDHSSSQEGSLTCKASKVFICDDLAGQNYLCYVIPVRNQLCMAHLDVATDGSDKISLGAVNSVSAKDAVPIPGLHMLAVLEHNGNVTLYSGLTSVGKLHIGGTLVQHAPSPYVRRSMSQFHSPCPRRSSLLPHVKQTDPRFDEHLLSPVLPEGSALPRLQMNFPLDRNTVPKAVITGLQDPIENRITLKYSDGTYYRITLPCLTSNALIESCFVTLQKILPKDLSSGVLIKWYAKRNALGTQDVSVEQEWSMFEDLLFELLGYETEEITKRSKTTTATTTIVASSASSSDDHPVTPSAASNPKRQKPTPASTDDDWIRLLNSDHERKISDSLKRHLKIRVPTNSVENVTKGGNSASSKPSKRIKVDARSMLFPHIRTVHFALHLLYEDLKLNVLRYEELKSLGHFLYELSCDLELEQYSAHYRRDFPDVCPLNPKERTKVIKQSDKVKIQSVPFVEPTPPSVMYTLDVLIKGRGLAAVGEHGEVEKSRPIPYVEGVNERTKDVLQISAQIVKFYQKHTTINDLIKIFVPTLMRCREPKDDEFPIESTACCQTATMLMVERQFTGRHLATLPLGVFYLFHWALWRWREKPPLDWPAEAYYLIGRDDLAALAEKGEKTIHQTETYTGARIPTIAPSAVQFDGSSNPPKQNATTTSSSTTPDSAIYDGMEDVVEDPLMKLRFAKDLRVLEARNLLQSAKPARIRCKPKPDMSEHDIVEDQEKFLYSLCARTMALPVGRGMFTLRTSAPVITEPLPIPQLNLTGRSLLRNTTIELTHIDTPANMNLWPLFHNGVANGLRISPDAHSINDTWIIFNKPKGSMEQQMEHAGFLMALGLNGHLKNLDLLNTYDYLSKLHEMTSIGVLLGLSAAFRGTSHTVLTKILSIHVEALLPPTSMELDVPQNIQVAALLGVGLVYQGTSHRHIIEILLSEIGRPPGPEMENSVDRESYSLAAGLALGLVTLKQGQNTAGLSDLNISDTLYYYMVGGNKRPLKGAQKDKYKVSSFQIREGSSVNLDVTAPGATIALGLMYFGTGNKAVANWMAPPETQYLLDFVRPDFLLFRTLSRSLILWDEVEPTIQWIEGQVPSSIRPYCMVKPWSSNDDIDYEAMNQAYCNIVTGACFALGLKYAGSRNQKAYKTLLHFCRMFIKLTVKSIAELAGKLTVETCLNVVLVSMAMIVAGTGDLQVMRFVRFLRKRVGTSTCTIVTYGSHLATHMALGLLYLGGGRYTLSNSPESIAALICAFYPKFPTHSYDNRYHLQAFRHLYVLAVQQRLVIPRDINTGKSCYVKLRIVWLDGTGWLSKGPTIVPDINNLKKIAVEDDRYWTVVFERGRNWDQLLKILSTTGHVDVKQRAGCLDRIEDKDGYHSALAKTLHQSQVVPWDPSPSSIVSFSHDATVKCFCEHFLIPAKSHSINNNKKNNSINSDKSDSTSERRKKLPRPKALPVAPVTEPGTNMRELKWRQMLTRVTYDAVIKDKLFIVPIVAQLFETVQRYPATSNLSIWQLKLISSHVLNPLTNSDNLLSDEIILSLNYALKDKSDLSSLGFRKTEVIFAKKNPKVMNMSSTSLAQDTPLPNLSKFDLTRARCASCNLYLSYGPICIDSEGDNSCGRCSHIIELPQNINVMYELLARYVQFPCIFDSFGCNEKIRFNDVPTHEAKCRFREIVCPASDCQERKCLQLIKDHFVERHPNLVIENAQFEFPFGKVTPTVYIVNVNGLDVLLHIRPNSGRLSVSGKYDLALGIFDKTEEIDNFKCSLKLTSMENFRSLIIDMPQLSLYQPSWDYPKQNVLTVDIGSLRSLLGSKVISFELVCDKNPTKGQSDKGPLVNLECNICTESMKPPIYICKTGHSICSLCRKRVNICPTCQGTYEGTRNFQLEELTERNAIPEGSKSSASPTYEQDTSTEDDFGCLLNIRSCRSWKGTIAELYVHLESRHPQCTVFRFGEEKQITMNKHGWVFVTQFDGMPFIVSIKLVSSESFSSPWLLGIIVTEVDPSAPQTSNYKFSLRAMPEFSEDFKFIRSVRPNLKEVIPIEPRFLVSMDPNPTVDLIIDAERVQPKKCPHCKGIVS